MLHLCYVLPIFSMEFTIDLVYVFKQGLTTTTKKREKDKQLDLQYKKKKTEREDGFHRDKASYISEPSVICERGLTTSALD